MPQTKTFTAAATLLETLKSQVNALETLIHDAQQMPVYRDAGRKEALVSLDIAKQACLIGSTAVSIEKIVVESANKGFFKITNNT